MENCTFHCKPIHIIHSVCDNIDDIKAEDWEEIHDGEFGFLGTSEYKITVKDKIIFQYEIPLNHPQEQDLNLNDLEGRILVREIERLPFKQLSAFYDPKVEDYEPEAINAGVAYKFRGIIFQNNNTNELVEYELDEDEFYDLERYFEYYFIKNGEPERIYI